MMKRRSKLLICFLLVALIVSACASGYKAFMIADQQYTEAVQKYNAYYEIASDTTKAKWNKEIDPWIVKADDALDIWKASLLAGSGSADKQQAFLEIKTKLLQLLVQEGIIKVEG